MGVGGDGATEGSKVHDAVGEVGHERHDAGRAASNEELLAQLHLGWVRRLVEERPGQGAVVHRVQVDDKLDGIRGQAAHLLNASRHR